MSSTATFSELWEAVNRIGHSLGHDGVISDCSSDEAIAYACTQYPEYTLEQFDDSDEAWRLNQHVIQQLENDRAAVQTGWEFGYWFARGGVSVFQVIDDTNAALINSEFLLSPQTSCRTIVAVAAGWAQGHKEVVAS